MKGLAPRGTMMLLLELGEYIRKRILIRERCWGGQVFHEDSVYPHCVTLTWRTLSVSSRVETHLDACPQG